MPSNIIISTLPACRQRYVDMIVTEETRTTFRSRSRIVSTIRRHLEDKSFLEVGAGRP